MMGRTELSLSKAEMLKALEYYLNERVLKEPHVVSNITSDAGGSCGGFDGGFKVTLEEKTDRS